MNLRRFPHAPTILALVPFTALTAVYIGLGRSHFHTPDGLERSMKHGEFWGGNPPEVYSHCMNTAFMTGSAAALAWLIAVEAVMRRSEAKLGIIYLAIPACVVSSALMSTLLDLFHGEGVTAAVILVAHIPLLGSTYYLLRRGAALARWRPAVVVPLAAGFAALHAAAQLVYEPSGDGGPNGRIAVPWLAGVALAFAVWAAGWFRSGRARAFAARLMAAARRPLVSGGTGLAVLAVMTPLTLYAQRVRADLRGPAVRWLDGVESELSGEHFQQIKKVLMERPSGSGNLPPAVGELFRNEENTRGFYQRIFIPIREDAYLFVVPGYADIRSLRPGLTEQINQTFIDRLIETGKDGETGLFSALWSPYVAGRAVKNPDGSLKALCVVEVR